MVIKTMQWHWHLALNGGPGLIPTFVFVFFLNDREGSPLFILFYFIFMIEKMATTCNIDPDKGSKPQHKRKKEKHVYRERKSPTYVVKVSAKIRNLDR